MKTLNYNRVKPSLVVSLLFGLIILVLSLTLGKNEFFLLVNGNWGPIADVFFKYVTFLGDGMLWGGWLLYVLVTKRCRLLPLLITAVLSLTLITQVCKQVILPNEARPLSGIPDQTEVHYVKDVVVHSINSFPSGHTATAFVYALLVTLISNKKKWVYLSFIVAGLVGFSRIYLGQHFPLDVGAGVIAACLCFYFAVCVQRWYDKRNWGIDNEAVI